MNTFALRAMADSIWLADPIHFGPVVAKVLNAGRCFTAREVIEARQEAFDRIGDLIADAAVSTGHNFQSEGGGTKQIRAVKGKVGVIPIWGPVQQRMSSELMKAGGTSLDFVSAALNRMMADPAIGCVVLHFDSPGGSSFGVEELAAKINNASKSKPIYAMIDSIAASAAYWLASAASMIVMTPSGLAGSIGVYIMHVDESAALAKDGLAVTMVSAARYKTELSSHAPLSSDARANLQRHVDGIYSTFIGAVKTYRKTSTEHVRTRFGEGRVMNAADALAVGVCDRILSFEDLMARLTGQNEPTSKVSAGASSRGLNASAQLEMIRLRAKYAQQN